MNLVNRGAKKSRKVKLSKLLIVLLVLIGVCCTIWILFKIINNRNKTYYSYQSRVEELKEKGNQDSDVVGWIQVQGTSIDYPVVDVDEKSSIDYDYLWLSDEYFEGENRQVIYGHNILNVSSKPIVNGQGHTRFEPLMAFVYENFAKKNLYINYTYDGEDHLYKIYAVSFASIDEEIGQSYLNGEMTEKYIARAKEESIYDYDVEVDSTDNLISLITCTRYFGLDGKTQFRVDAREIRDNETVTKYSVEANSNYEEVTSKDAL